MGKFEKVPFEMFFLWKFVSIQWISGCLLLKKQIVVRIGVHVVPIDISLRHPKKVEASDRRRDYYVHYMVPIDRQGIPIRLKLLIFED